MNKLIACCGLDCSKCDARKATIDNDDELREKVAREWSILNNVEITKDMINCVGCRIEGVKFPFCESMCPIRICCKKNEFDTCSNCDKLHDCEKIKMVISTNQEAKERLEKI